MRNLLMLEEHPSLRAFWSPFLCFRCVSGILVMCACATTDLEPGQTLACSICMDTRSLYAYSTRGSARSQEK